MEILPGVGVLFFPTRHFFFPQRRFFGVLGFLRRLTHGKDYSFYFYFYFIIPEEDFWRKLWWLRGSTAGTTNNKYRDIDETYRLPQTTMPTQKLDAQINSYQLPRSSKGVLIGLRDQTTKEEGSCHEHPTSCQRASSRQPDTPHHLSSSVAARSGIPTSYDSSTPHYVYSSFIFLIF